MVRADSDHQDGSLRSLVHAGIEKLRAKLLDLSMANRLLNFKHSDKSRSHIRVIDEIPELLCDNLDQHKNLHFKWIEEPDSEPADEQNDAFQRAVSRAKESDQAYLEEKEKLGRHASKRQLAKFERALRDRVRLDFGLLPRTIPSISDRARQLGINPSYDLPDAASPQPREPSLKVQTLFYREGMESKLATIREGDRTLLQDAGISALYAAFGFVEWYETTDSTTSAFAPLVFYPVEIQRTLEQGMYRYMLVARDDEVETNRAFGELLRSNFGIELPLWSDDENLRSYFHKVQQLLLVHKRWKFKSWVTIGLFTFSKLAMYQDLDSKRWTATGALELHPVLSDLFAGTGSVQEATLAPDYDLDAQDKPQPSDHLVTNADSSQHSAIIDVMSGRNLVIQGPPGTGKSQTITNIIAVALNAGKRVLFVAEKMAALHVVKDRLDHFGIGRFCLEVHSNKTRKSEVLKVLESRINAIAPPLDRNEIRHTLDSYEKTRKELIHYVTRMKEEVGETGLTVHEILTANCVRTQLAAWLPRAAIDARLEQPDQLNNVVRRELSELSRDLELRATAVNKWGEISKHPWRGMTNENLDVLQIERLLALSQILKQSLGALDAAFFDGVSRSKWPIENSLRGVREFVDKASKLPLANDGIVAHIVRYVTTQKRLATLGATVADIDRLASFPAGLDVVTTDRQLFALLESGPLKQYLKEWRRLGVGDKRVGEIASLSLAKASSSSAIEKARAAASGLCALFGMNASRISDLQDMMKAVKLLQAVPRAALMFRSAPIIAEENRETIHRAAKTSEALHTLRSILNEKFRLSIAPPHSEIEKGARILLSCGFVRRHITRSGREAWRLYKSLAISPANRAVDAGQELANLAANLLRINDFESDSELRRVTGQFFHGSQTPWKDLVTISNWACDVRQAFPSRATRSDSIRDLLLTGDVVKLDSLLEFAQSQEHSCLSRALLEAADSYESTLDSMANSSRVSADEMNRLSSVFGALRLKAECRIEDLEIACSILAEVETLKIRLKSQDVENLLGSPADSWVNRRSELRETFQFLGSLATIGLPETVWDCLREGPPVGVINGLKEVATSLQRLLTAVENKLQQFSDLARPDSEFWPHHQTSNGATITELESRLNYALSNKDGLEPYLDFVRLENSAKPTSLAPILKALAGEANPYARLPIIFDFVFYRSCAEQLLMNDQKLVSHSGASHEQLRQRYQQLDRRLLELRRKEIAITLLNRPIPQGVGQGRASDFTDLALIRRQIGLQRRHLPLRDLFQRAGGAIQALMPCFMMSPMSVAQFLVPGGLQFDLVVMDEASQIRPEDAAGAIARGKQIVVVGDPKQLPPTPFFEKLDRDDTAEDDESEEAEVQDLAGQESILDLASAPYQPIRRLSWHYRSQHESLIAFSNGEFYDKSLIVFPSPHGNDPKFGVHSVEVAGVYNRSLNHREAEEVLAAAQVFMRESCDRSLGIVAMNKPQQELIQKMMDDLYATDVAAEAYRLRWEQTLEPVFVKNLENVQGDERDVIFISTVYGRDAAGNFFQRLGPINSRYGHRRLNVLFTRAKQELRLFTSMKPSDLRIELATSWGVKVLKNFISYARDGHSEVGEFTGREVESEFERWVMEMLHEQGYEVVPQMGVAGYFIDLAVRHPEHSASFILGVECDGATYHSGRSVRDRDRLRQEVLERLGWKIYRIWSTDWFRNPRASFAKLVEAIEDLRHARN